MQYRDVELLSLFIIIMIVTCTPSRHRPPFWHGFGRHSLTSLHVALMTSPTILVRLLDDVSTNRCASGGRVTIPLSSATLASSPTLTPITKMSSLCASTAFGRVFSTSTLAAPSVIYIAICTHEGRVMIPWLHVKFQNYLRLCRCRAVLIQLTAIETEMAK